MAKMFLNSLSRKHLLYIGGIILLVIAIIVIPTVVVSKEGFELETPNLKAEDDEIVVGLFWADWCPHCVSFKPVFEKVAEDLANTKTKQSGKKLRFEKVDCVALAPLAKKYGVQGYPTIKIIQNDGSMDEYEGSREENEFAKYLMTL
jgi:thiol-disulfide isomerase/thioredoxin